MSEEARCSCCGHARIDYSRGACLVCGLAPEGGCCEGNPINAVGDGPAVEVLTGHDLEDK